MNTTRFTRVAVTADSKSVNLCLVMLELLESLASLNLIKKKETVIFKSVVKRFINKYICICKFQHKRKKPANQNEL